MRQYVRNLIPFSSFMSLNCSQHPARKNRKLILEIIIDKINDIPLDHNQHNAMNNLVVSEFSSMVVLNMNDNDSSSYIHHILNS